VKMGADTFGDNVLSGVVIYATPGANVYWFITSSYRRGLSFLLSFVGLHLDDLAVAEQPARHHHPDLRCGDGGKR
jgi:hypothetical protein